MTTATPSPWQWVRRWFFSRDRRLLLLGLPALAAGAALLVLAWLAATTPAGETRARYQREGKAASARQDHARALTCFEHLAPEADEQPELLFQLALAAEKAGQTDRAVSLMRELAPTDHRGYGPAHLWWARLLLRVPTPTERLWTLAETHLVRALDGELEDPTDAHLLLGRIYLGRGRLDDAELHLHKAAKLRPQEPQVRRWLADTYKRRKEPARARQEAQMALNLYRGKAKADLNNHLARLGWADALTFQEDYPGAVAVLEEGLSATGEGVYRGALARVYLGWYENRKQAKAPTGETYGLLQKGLSCDPTNRDLLDRMLDVLRTPGKEADETRAELEKVLASGKATAFTHFALSVDALQRDKKEQARLHLERAHEIDPRLAVISNNLAWSLIQSDKPDLHRALRLATLAVEQEPNNPNFRDTRGRIYARMGRDREALADLEAALARDPKSPPLHLALAEVYEKLGSPRLAAEHRRLARGASASP